MTEAPDEVGQRRLRAGVLGTGYWAQWCHAAVLADHPAIEFVGVWGRDPAKTTEAADRVGGRPFASPEDLFAATDLIAIALPPDVQADLAVRAARAGQHVLLDKPVAFTVAAADAIVEAADLGGVATLTFLTYRFQPTVTAWLAQMKRLADQAGPWEGVDVRCFGSIDTPGSPYRGSVWRRNRGGLWDWGPHALSVIDAILPPVSYVSAVPGVRDTVTVVCEHEGGPSSTMVLTCLAAGAVVESSVTVWGPAGRFQLPLPTGELREAYRRAVDDLVSSISTATASSLDARYGRDLVAILSAAQEQIERAPGERAALPAPRLSRSSRPS